MNVLVFVEGPSDRIALETLLRPVVEEAKARRVGISFLPQGGKDAILREVPLKAAARLAERPEDWVFALPDLHPTDPDGRRGNPHSSFDDLRRLLWERFDSRAGRLGLAAHVRRRFRVHCLQHDLEALVLAAPDALRQRLGTRDQLRGAWRRPVEDQNGQRPPKRVVEELFSKYRPKPGYVDTNDAPWILGRADLAAVERACSQRFAPFVRELRALARGQALRDVS